ncbi:hypothetical protein [Pelagibacterium lacus]|uniref:Uncharacterized protein n=1 Tax=Pelagibacterium lacus TaxID=2282655 RepID=A0A369W1G2_9HYPH|nr:hypothetical protein [Pelagibacterium lacus]RDE08378.1 hypothetical protein DVH29_11650 [Pelagibacterium lacus]
MATKDNTPLVCPSPDGQSIADLMAEADKVAINIDALLFLIEEAAWKMVNYNTSGRVCTLEDHNRAAALHTAAEMARRDFLIVQEAVSEGGQFITVRASGSADEEIIAAYQDWAAAYDALALAENDTENTASYEAFRDAEAKVLGFVPTTARGLAIQVTVFTSFYEFDTLADKHFDIEAHLEAVASVKRPASFRGGEALDLDLEELA